MLRTALVLAACLAVLQAAPAQSMQNTIDAARRRPLKGVKKVALFFQAPFKKGDGDAELKTDVELILRQSGIEVSDGITALVNRSDEPVLWVTYDFGFEEGISGSALLVRVKLEKTIVAPYDPTLKVGAMLYDEMKLGVIDVGAPDWKAKVRQRYLDQVKAFVNDWLVVNPK